MKQIELKGGAEVTVETTPGKGKLSTRDWLLGLLMAVAAPVMLQLYELLMAFLDYQPVEIDWRMLAKTGISAGSAYIVKNLFDKQKIVIDPAKLAEAKKD